MEIKNKNQHEIRTNSLLKGEALSSENFANWNPCNSKHFQITYFPWNDEQIQHNVTKNNTKEKKQCNINNRMI